MSLMLGESDLHGYVGECLLVVEGLRKVEVSSWRRLRSDLVKLRARRVYGRRKWKENVEGEKKEERGFHNIERESIILIML